MADIRDQWLLDIDPLIRALRQGAAELDKVRKEFQEVGQEADHAAREEAKVGDEATKAAQETQSAAKTMKTAYVTVAAAVDATTVAETKVGAAAVASGRQAQTAGIQLKGAYIAAAAAAAVVVGTISRVVNRAREWIETSKRIIDQSREIGATAEGFQRASGALELLTRGGIDLGSAMGTLNQRIDEARQGVGEAEQNFDRLGLNLESLVKMDADEKLLAIADAMSRLDDQAAVTNISAGLFERQGRRLSSVWMDGAAAIRAAMDEVEQAGLISEKAAAGAGELGSALDLMKRAGQAALSDVLVPMIPTIQEGTEKIRDMLAEARESGDLERMGEALNKLFTREILDGLTQTLDLFIKLGAAIGPLATAFGVLSGTASALPDVLLDAAGTMTGLQEECTRTEKNLRQVGLGFLVAKEEGDKYIATMEEAALVSGFFGDELERTKQIKIDLIRTLRAQKSQQKDTTAATKAETDAVEELASALADLSSARLGPIRAMDWGLSDEDVIRWETATNAAMAYARAVKSGTNRMHDARAEAAALLGEIEGGMEAVVPAISRTFQAVTDIVGATIGESNSRFRKFAKAMIAAEESIAIALSTMNIIAAATSWARGTTSWQEGIAIIGMAVGEIVAAVASISKASAAARIHTGTLSVREVPAVLEVGEGIVSRQGMAQPGAPETVAALNRGQQPDGGRYVIINKVDNRTTAAAEFKLLRAGGGPVKRLIDAAQPYSLGLRVPIPLGA